MNAVLAPATVWVHVSTLMAWTRPPVGIVRVEQEYCRWLLARGDQDSETIRFCIYNRALRRFEEVAREQVLAKLQPAATPAQAPRAPLAGWKLRAKAMARAVLPYLPAPWVAPLRSNARLAYHHFLVRKARMQGLLQRLRDRLAGQAAASADDGPRAPFAPGDRLVSLGLDWDYLDQKELFRIKQQLGLKTTLICYDVIPVLFPQLVVLPPGGFGAYVVDMAWCADAVLCISEYTRKDCEAVLRRLGAPVPPTHVIHLGSELRGAQGEGAPPAGFSHGPADRPFVLFVSTIERRKNHEILYRAWTRLREQGITPHRLVFVGMQGWGVSDLMNDLRLDPRVQDDIVSLNHVSDGELAWLYRHAAFTVFPSLYEGWGLPLVESLAWGKFCLASNAASLPEAGGDFAEYLDPWDLPAWVERLAHYMQHPEEVSRHNARIAREFRAPTWAGTAETIHRVALQAEPGQGER